MMWAAIKSDLREFATGAAEETNAASEKVVGKKIIPNDVNIDGVHALADGVGNVMGGAIRGLVGVSSMVGGIVAPRNAATDISFVNRRAINNNIMVTTTTTTPPPPPSAPVSMALSSMLAAVAAGEDDDEEEEMGWDDDDDDVVDDDYVEDNDLDTDERAHGEKRMADNSTDDAAADTTPFNDVEMPVAAESGAAISAASHDDSKALMALKTKLASVEKSRNELQSEHRRQTDELVELRSKVEEYERQQQQQSEDDQLQKQHLDEENEGENKSEQMRNLQLQVEQLKSQLVEQVEVLKQEHKEYVTLIQREKEELDRELNEERQRNDDLMRQNTALVDNKRSDKDEEEAKELLLHQSQINALEMELSSLRTNLDTTTCELLSVKEHMTNQELVHREEIQHQLAITNDIEERLLRTKEEYTRAIISSEVNESKVTQTESETQTDSSVTTPPLNISPDDTASEDTVVSTSLPIPQDASFADDVVDNNKSFATANEELLEAGAPSPSPSSGTSPAIKVDITEDELSDDWGDGGW